MILATVGTVDISYRRNSLAPSKITLSFPLPSVQSVQRIYRMCVPHHWENNNQEVADFLDGSSGIHSKFLCENMVHNCSCTN
jgi:hypothetical protein